MKKYSIGVDFGTLSGRALLVEVATGRELASAVYEYPHGVLDEALPCGKQAGAWTGRCSTRATMWRSWSIPFPRCCVRVGPTRRMWLASARTLPPAQCCLSRRTAHLCAFLPEFEENPHAWVKLWKHHAAQPQANRLNEIAAARGEPWLGNYGGKISSEWAIPKLWQVLEEAPEVYQAMDRWIEAADWIVWQLTGQESRNSCTAGYKELWNKRAGYPAPDFFKALDPRMEHVVEEKLGTVITPLGSRAGGLCPAMAAKLGLPVGTPVAVGNVDAHVCVPAVGIDGPGKMLAIIGTSTCHMMMGREENCRCRECAAWLRTALCRASLATRRGSRVWATILPGLLTPVCRPLTGRRPGAWG